MPIFTRYIEKFWPQLITLDVYNLQSSPGTKKMEPSSPRREKIRQMLEHEANTQGIVQASMAMWDKISLPLARMIGRLGVASLFERCVSVQSTKYPWLPHGSKAILDDSLYTSVWQGLTSLPADEALNASTDIFTCFFEQLSQLIGERLTMKVFLTGIPDDSDKPKDPESS